MLNIVQQQIAQQARNRPKPIVNRPGAMVPGRPTAVAPQQQMVAQRQGLARLGVGGIGLQKGKFLIINVSMSFLIFSNRSSHGSE